MTETSASTSAHAPGTVRTRFAPSPTGYLHVGTARTALFSYLLARRHGGSFVLRIEDTDAERNVDGGAEAVVDALRWLGLSWDEGYQADGPNGPYVQSERGELYRTVVNTLLAEGHAYLDWRSAEDLGEERAAAQAAGLPPLVRGRPVSDAQVLAYRAEGRHPAVRFRMPTEGATVVDDLVRGEVTFEHTHLSDFVLVRADGSPTYMLAAVVDDVDMHITHVVRGEDLLSSTPRQIQLFRALGAEPPRFAHLPLLVGADRRKLSKRHGSVAVQSFRERGYLPEALVNYLALLGWSLDDHTERFTLAELEEVFSVERVTRNPAAFDEQKLDALNGQYLRALDVDEFVRRALPFVEAAGYPAADPAVLRAAAPLVQERVGRLDEVPGMVGFLYDEQIHPAEEDIRKVLKPGAVDFLTAVAAGFVDLEPWTAARIEELLRALQQEHGLGAKRAFQPVRLAVTGRLVSPPLFESLELLGRRHAVARVEAAAKLAGAAGE